MIQLTLMSNYPNVAASVLIHFHFIHSWNHRYLSPKCDESKIFMRKVSFLQHPTSRPMRTWHLMYVLRAVRQRQLKWACGVSYSLCKCQFSKMMMTVTVPVTLRVTIWQGNQFVCLQCVTWHLNENLDFICNSILFFIFFFQWMDSIYLIPKVFVENPWLMLSQGLLLI